MMRNAIRLLAAVGITVALALGVAPDVFAAPPPATNAVQADPAPGDPATSGDIDREVQAVDGLRHTIVFGLGVLIFIAAVTMTKIGSK